MSEAESDHSAESPPVGRRGSVQMPFGDRGSADRGSAESASEAGSARNTRESWRPGNGQSADSDEPKSPLSPQSPASPRSPTFVRKSVSAKVSEGPASPSARGSVMTRKTAPARGSVAARPSVAAGMQGAGTRGSLKASAKSRPTLSKVNS